MGLLNAFLVYQRNSARNRFLAAPVPWMPNGDKRRAVFYRLQEAVHLVSGEQTNLLHRTMIGGPTKCSSAGRR